MKFGEQMTQLSVPGWEAHYINYTRLKGILKGFKVGGDEESGQEVDLLAKEAAHKAFFVALEAEVDKVQRFYSVQLASYEPILRKARLDFHDKESVVPGGASSFRHRSGRSGRRNSGAGGDGARDVDQIATTVSFLVHDLMLLGSFVEVNRTACRKIIKKHDKVSGGTTLNLVLEALADKRSFFIGDRLTQLAEDCKRFKSEVSKYIIKTAR